MNCPGCGRPVAFSPHEVGLKVECERCSVRFVLGEAPGPVPGLRPPRSDASRERPAPEGEYGPGLARFAFFGTFATAALWLGVLLAAGRPDLARILFGLAGLLSWVALVLSAVAFVGSAKWYASTRRWEGIVGLGASAFAFLTSAGFCTVTAYSLVLAAGIVRVLGRP